MATLEREDPPPLTPFVASGAFLKRGKFRMEKKKKDYSPRELLSADDLLLATELYCSLSCEKALSNEVHDDDDHANDNEDCDGESEGGNANCNNNNTNNCKGRKSFSAKEVDIELNSRIYDALTRLTTNWSVFGGDKEEEKENNNNEEEEEEDAKGRLSIDRDPIEDGDPALKSQQLTASRSARRLIFAAFAFLTFKKHHTSNARNRSKEEKRETAAEARDQFAKFVILLCEGMRIADRLYHQCTSVHSSSSLRCRIGSSHQRSVIDCSSEAEMKLLFDLFDVDGDGEISAKDLEQIPSLSEVAVGLHQRQKHQEDEDKGQQESEEEHQWLRQQQLRDELFFSADGRPIVDSAVMMYASRSDFLHMISIRYTTHGDTTTKPSKTIRDDEEVRRHHHGISISFADFSKDPFTFPLILS